MSRIESERQWLVEGPFQWPERIGGHRGGCTEQRVVIDRYFDTGDRSLSRLGATLRLRTQEGDLVATLKRPLADDRPGARRRLELETPVDGAPEDIDDFAAALATFVELTPARSGKVGELRRRLQSEPST